MNENLILMRCLFSILIAINFQKWIQEKLLPNIPPNSVIVKDNAAYHCTQIDKKPNMGLKRKMSLERRDISLIPTKVSFSENNKPAKRWQTI